MVQVSFPTCSVFPSSADVIIVSRGSSIIVQSKPGGVRSYYLWFPILTNALIITWCGPSVKSKYDLLPKKRVSSVAVAQTGNGPPSI